METKQDYVETREIYDRDKIEIPKDEGKSFLEISNMLSIENYSGPFDGGEKDAYRFETMDRNNNFIIVNPVKGTMKFNYISSDGKEQSKKRFLSIKKSLENKFGVQAHKDKKGTHMYKVNRCGRWDLSDD